MPSSGRAIKKDEPKVYARFSSELGLYVQLTMIGKEVAGVKLLSELPGSLEGNNHPYLERIIKHIETGKDDMLDIPIRFDGTIFQKRILEALRKVPTGQTVTYGQLAKNGGSPKAARAVGQVCASNPFAILVPCHRVLPASGKIGNYTSDGGPKIKKMLLEKEGAL